MYKKGFIQVVVIVVIGLAIVGWASWESFKPAEQQFGLATFKSIQVGTAPTNGDILTTDGSDSTWVTGASLGFGAGGGAYPFTPSTAWGSLAQSTTSLLAFPQGLISSSTIGRLTVGTLTATSTATSTFTGGISTSRVNATATSTFNGLQLEGGCLLYKGSCLTSSGTPGGSDTQIQFNDGGSFGGSADFTFDKTSSVAGVSNGGSFILTTGTGGDTSGSGGSIYLTAGSAQAGDSDGGNLTFQSGGHTGSGNPGDIQINGGTVNIISTTDFSETFSAIFDTSKLLTANRTFSFPDWSGEFAISTSTLQVSAINATSTILSSRFVNASTTQLSVSTKLYAPLDSSILLSATTTMGTGTTTYKFSGFPQPFQFTQVGCVNTGTGTFVAQLGNGTASSTAVLSATGLTTSFTALSSNNSYTAGQAVFLSWGSVSGAVAQPTCSYTRLTK